MKDTFEIIHNEKTYISKKVNPTRRAMIIEKVIKSMGNFSQDAEKTINNLDSMIALIGTTLPEVMWDFIKDEDKKIIGTKETFVEYLDDKNCMEFLQWCIAKVNELNDFLGNSQKAVVPQ